MSRRPPCCPDPECELHTKGTKPPKWYTRDGTYETIAFGTVQRYLCKYCGKRFSEQTFALDYYAKKKADYHKIFRQIVTTGSTRDISRELGVSTATVANRISRLSRNAVAVLEELKDRTDLREAFVADGFESFAVSQYYPDNINLLLGKQSQYVWYLNYVTLRRKGRMRDSQKKRREELEKQFRPPPGALTAQFKLLLEEALSIADRSLKPFVLYTDEKKEYVRAAAAIPVLRQRKKEKRYLHIRISSKKARTLRNNLFAANYFDRELRKDQANHVRETVCFTRNVNNGIERLMIYVLYHNHCKDYRIGEAKYVGVTHGQIAGVSRSMEREALRHFFTRRFFLTLEPVRGEAKRVWVRGLITPLKRGREYLPGYALV